MKWFSCLLLAAVPAMHAGTMYVQTNLTSDIPGLAPNTDANLKNPWGMSFAPTSPFWISDQVTGKATLYDGTGAPAALIVTTPPGNPTGQLFNGSTGFVETNGKAATFLFSTLAGTIDAWNSSDGTTAEQMVTSTGAYTGLATNGTNLYAANFGTGAINMFNSSFAPVSATFTDPSLPAGYSPYNIQFLNGALYVEYVQVNPTTHRPQPGAGLGFVDVYDTSGNLQQRLIAGGALNAPWGITMAPAGFGQFGGDLLVGNFGDGTINAFDPHTGALLGTVSNTSGNPIVNSGLWSLAFRTGGPNVNTNALYITAGINNEADGLFAAIAPVPEPRPFALAGIALVLLLVRLRRHSPVA